MITGRRGVVRVCYFGTYSMEEGYPRNRVIIEGLRRKGVEVVECREEFWQDTTEKLQGLKDGSLMGGRFWRLLQTYGKLINKFRQVGPYDAMIVGYAGHIDIFLAKILNLFRKKPLIFDAFLSIYDTSVLDRKIVTHGSLKAKLLKLIDTWACRIADIVLLDTQAHIDFFVREFHLPTRKFFAIPVGSSFSDFPSFSDGKDEDVFEVLYFGSYIPLHGVDVIIRAAKILESQGDIVFKLIGVGQLLSEIKRLATEMALKNVVFIDRFIKESELIQYISHSDVCLGIFGQTDKALRVIPCKVYNCLAMGRPLITAMTPATKEVLKHMENAFLCIPGDPYALAEAILNLKKDDLLREKIARGGQEYFANHFSMESIGEKVMQVVESVV